MNVLWWILALIVGVVIGAVVTWLYFKLQRERAEAQIADLESQVAQLRDEPREKPVTFDAAAAKAAIGKTVKPDDLTLIEGVGPKIAGLLAQDGIGTWVALSKADVARLQRILDGAGPRYRVHSPATWPEQASLLATGKYDEFKALIDRLNAGK